jgi:hypothetical protein
LGIRTEINQLGAKFVAHHDVAIQIHDERSARAARNFNQFVSVPERMQIRTADPAGQGFDQDFAGTWCRNRNVVDNDLPVAHYCGTHAPSSLFASNSVSP